MSIHICFQSDSCKGCELCVMACPKKLIEISKHHVNSKGYHVAYVKDESLCVGCCSCARICPDSVIYVAKD